MWGRIRAILVARNREFYRDRAGLGWNIFMPILMILAFAFIFTGKSEDQLKIGVVTVDGAMSADAAGFLALRYLDFIPLADPAAAVPKVERHQLDLLVDTRGQPWRYWVNPGSAKGYIAERLLLGSAGQASGAVPRRQEVTGEAIGYADWVLPGILAMNVMFSSLWGVGWVVVRYRKNGVLRRLRATPLSAAEFLIAQVLSRLMVVLGASLVVFLGSVLVLDSPMRGSYGALALTFVCGGLCMISLGLIVSARLRTEELADGILNLISWPMMLLSGVWFSMEGTSEAARLLSRLSPLTHLVDAARGIMIDGAGVVDVLPECLLLLALTAVLLTVAAALFRWE